MAYVKIIGHSTNTQVTVPSMNEMRKPFFYLKFHLCDFLYYKHTKSNVFFPVWTTEFDKLIGQNSY